ncbi:MAG: ATP-binding protein [Thermoanaerobaculia bacterium]|nr:ATP-binding protein [Thermoanaerobaculia bacterium]
MATKLFREVELVLPMEPNREIEAGETASELAASVGMHPDRIDELRMAVHEACINAFEHSLAPDEKVYLTMRILGEDRPEVLRVTVRDMGVGFSPEIVDGTIPPKREGPRKRGWGLTIIRNLMDDVEIQSNAGGTVVVMEKEIESEPPSMHPGESRR